MNNHINCGEAFDLMHGEERRMEAADIKAAQRDEKIGALTKEYFNDVGTFFEFIQGIEISEKDLIWFELWHEQVSRNNWKLSGMHVDGSFREYCKEKATEDIDDAE